MAKKSGFRDDKAPKWLTVIIQDDQGKKLKEALMPAKEFSTGSVGFYASDKLINPENAEAQYQLGFSATLIGSKG
jgi:hypothetical protein